MRHLSRHTLSAVDPGVPTPTYDRGALTPGIVHIGVGGFHRAHQAMYVDRLMARGAARDWGISGVGVLPQDRRMKDVLTAQDGLYTLMVKHPDGSVSPRVIGSLLDYHLAPDDPERVIERMAAPETSILSLTITEGGYTPDAARATTAPSGAQPSTVSALVVEALARRRARGVGPFTVVSCDNIEGNGDAARRLFCGSARLRDPALGDWIEEHVRFPSSMVDRITPSTSDEDRSEAGAILGVADAWPVVCEPFTQWVLEDEFDGRRPPLEEVGVQLVADVRPYELMKLRLLNASHQLMCYLGYLAGHRHVHEVGQDPLFARLVARYMDEEASPTLGPLPGVDVAAYKSTLLDRFANPTIRDSLARICADTSDRVPVFLLPVVREQLAGDGNVDISALAVAAWARYAEGIDEQGVPITVVDPLRDRLMSAAAQQATAPLAFLRVTEVFGDLAEDRRFAEAYVNALSSLHRVGARRTIEHLLAVSRA
ncbi:MAG: Multiple polyol-specific dehydrogenase [uncultured Nocardioides sp.]|uniref:Mannitol-1-phosphate 5-dehydrogenase n=1 Tax=uncultured Nocardioides sp. TaxID=198441 RepID=A0A6J4NBZ2_9ACTN|nr:MAG: Multiple polyol-specific dehydrogenase [uncultured Nocardioides sp.]